MTVAQTKSKSLFRRAFDALKALEDAFDYGPYDFVLDRVRHLESEIAELKTELEQIRASSNGKKAGSE